MIRRIRTPTTRGSGCKPSRKPGACRRHPPTPASACQAHAAGTRQPDISVQAARGLLPPGTLVQGGQESAAFLALQVQNPRATWAFLVAGPKPNGRPGVSSGRSPSWPGDLDVSSSQFQSGRPSAAFPTSRVQGETGDRAFPRGPDPSRMGDCSVSPHPKGRKGRFLPGFAEYLLGLQRNIVKVP